METGPAAAVSRKQWRDIVSRLAPEPDLTADEVALLAKAHWWLCDIPEATRLQELLHDRHLAEGRPVDAADAGLRVSLMWGTRGNVALSKAWLERASRLLVGQPTPGPLTRTIGSSAAELLVSTPLGSWAGVIDRGV